jgi:DNA-binding NarL/FixJ family response regulator
MKVLIVSNDINLLKIFKSDLASQFDLVNVYAESNDPLDLMSTICSDNPKLLIVDDDFLKPNSAHLLNSVRKVNKDLIIIFITSDPSINLGREISQLGIYFYAYKPIDPDEIKDSISALTKSKLQNQY